MATGHPDYLTWSGRSGGGSAVISYSFSGAIAGESSGSFDLPVVAALTNNVYQCIAVSCNDDSAIHNITMSRVSDAWVFYEINFITGGILNFPGQEIGAGQTVRVTVTNNSAGALTFEGSVFYVTRSV